MADERRCRFCNGRGYHVYVCGCWPGDCICGFGDEPCDECEGTGFVGDDDDDFDFEEPPHGE